MQGIGQRIFFNKRISTGSFLGTTIIKTDDSYGRRPKYFPTFHLLYLPFKVQEVRPS